jgi:hypothetical protein
LYFILVISILTWRVNEHFDFSNNKQTLIYFCFFFKLDICLQENVGFEESVENLNLIKEFCDKYITTKPYCFNFEDFLYSPSSMKINKLAFIAELFYWFELQPVKSLVKYNHFDLFKEYIKSNFYFYHHQNINVHFIVINV